MKAKKRLKRAMRIIKEIAEGPIIDPHLGVIPGDGELTTLWKCRYCGADMTQVDDNWNYFRHHSDCLWVRASRLIAAQGVN